MTYLMAEPAILMAFISFSFPTGSILEFALENVALSLQGTIMLDFFPSVRQWQNKPYNSHDAPAFYCLNLIYFNGKFQQEIQLWPG